MRYILFILPLFIGLGSLCAQDTLLTKPFIQDSLLRNEFQNKKPWYQVANKTINVLPIALVALDVTYYGQDKNSISQVGDQDAQVESGQIRAVRIGMGGTVNFKRPMRFLVTAAYKAFNQGFNPDSTTDFALFDCMLDADIKYGHIVLGLTNEPIGLQGVSSMIYLGGFERSMNTDAFLPIRNWGVTYYNSFARNKVFMELGYFKDLFLKTSTKKWNDANDIFVTRLVLNPLYKKGGDKDLHLGIGVRYGDFRHSASIGQHPEAYHASKYVQLRNLTGESLVTINYELAYRHRNLLLSSDITSVKLNNKEIGSPTLYGYYVQADYNLTGESRRYMTRNASFSPVVPDKNVQNGGIGAIELTARYSALYTNRGQLSGGDMTKYSGFITWYPTLLSKFQVGYGLVRLDRFNIVGYTQMFQMRFAMLIG
ncbi:hypothetical protein J1N10_18985 [Carboxylicivirga sp. A043]|uniref:porin n=1 Tax=Carboxylicivirga litoralis TaxID=2816963 RepID=UPI0021CB0014|nr:porin [Carboxylicivirga sp. A043]MCU4158068.1 hypothetical protein [Carboxylicivirga sp. A043]